MKDLFSSTPGPLPLMAPVLIFILVLKQRFTDQARQSWINICLCKFSLSQSNNSVLVLNAASDVELPE